MTPAELAAIEARAAATPESDDPIVVAIARSAGRLERALVILPPGRYELSAPIVLRGAVQLTPETAFSVTLAQAPGYSGHLLQIEGQPGHGGLLPIAVGFCLECNVAPHPGGGADSGQPAEREP